MAALALNSLKPHYHASLLGTMYAHAVEESDFAKEVCKAVDSAVAKVQANPAHI
jgi:competence protein ComFB